MPIIEAPSDTSLALDNDLFTHLRKREEHPYVEKHLRIYFQNTRKFPAVPALIIFEANFGIEKSLASNQISIDQANNHRENISQLLETFNTVLEFNRLAAEIAAYIHPRIPEKQLRSHKGKAKTFWKDVFIVATALAHNHGVATRNKKDMELISNYLPPSHNYLRLSVWEP